MPKLWIHLYKTKTHRFSYCFRWVCLCSETNQQQIPAENEGDVEHGRAPIPPRGRVHEMVTFSTKLSVLYVLVSLVGKWVVIILAIQLVALYLDRHGGILWELLLDFFWYETPTLVSGYAKGYFPGRNFVQTIRLQHKYSCGKSEWRLSHPYGTEKGFAPF